MGTATYGKWSVAGVAGVAGVALRTLARHAGDVELGEGLPLGLGLVERDRGGDLHTLVRGDGKAAVLEPVASYERHLY